MKDNAQKFDPKERIKKHNEGVKNLVFNQKVYELDLKYLFAYLNRMFFSDAIVGVSVDWAYNLNKTAGKVRNNIFNKFYSTIIKKSI